MNDNGQIYEKSRDSCRVSSGYNCHFVLLLILPDYGKQQGIRHESQMYRHLEQRLRLISYTYNEKKKAPSTCFHTNFARKPKSVAV